MFDLEYYLALFFITITGFCIGSFLNVVVCRAFSNESIVLPPSKCPKCQNRLKWWHNIPVISYLCLRGRCAFCKEPISIQYPIVETVCGISFAALFLKFGISWNFLFMLIFFSLFIVISATDIRERVIFTAHTYALIFVGLIYNGFNLTPLYTTAAGFNITSPIVASIFGIIAGFLIMELLARSGYLLAGKRAFGDGDSYIAAGLGAIFGWQFIVPVLLYAIVVMVILALPVFFKKLADEKDFVTIVSTLIFFSGAIAIKFLKYKGLLSDSSNLGLAVVLVLAGLGIFACKRILGGLRTSENLTYLPFGPAMIIGAVIFIFLQM